MPSVNSAVSNYTALKLSKARTAEDQQLTMTRSFTHMRMAQHSGMPFVEHAVSTIP